MDTFTRQYIETALWSTHDYSDDSGGAPLDQNYDISDIAPESLASMVADCEEFQRAHETDIAGEYSQAGHDFWLTRNGHGAGFWDGDWQEPAATRLTDAAHAYGSVDLYIGDDGKIYCS